MSLLPPTMPNELKQPKAFIPANNGPGQTVPLRRNIISEEKSPELEHTSHTQPLLKNLSSPMKSRFKISSIIVITIILANILIPTVFLIYTSSSQPKHTNLNNFNFKGASIQNQNTLIETDFEDRIKTAHKRNTKKLFDFSAENQNLIRDIDVDKLTSLTIRLKRNTIQASSLVDQTLPMLVSLAVEDLKLSYRAPLDLICVLDHSGSMMGEKIELLKNTFNYLLDFLNNEDRLSIVLFDHRASTLVPLLNTTESNKKKILSAVKTVSADGGTDINIGVEEAVKILKSRENVNQVTGIFLLSDGLDNRGGASQRVKSTLRSSGVQDGIIIHTFGFGIDHDPNLMTDIADITDGSFYFINQLDTIDEAFVSCIGKLQSSVADDVEIIVRPEQSEVLQGVSLVKAYGDAALWTKYDDVYVTKLKNLMTGIQRDYVLELKLPHTLAGLPESGMEMKVASVEAVINIKYSPSIIKKADLHITLVSEGTEIRDNDDREVMKNYYRVNGASLMDEARKLSDQGKHEEGKKILENFKEEVGNSLFKEEEFVKDLIKELEQAIKYVMPEVYDNYGRQSLMANHRGEMRGVHLTNTAISKALFDLAEKKNSR